MCCPCLPGWSSEVINPHCRGEWWQGSGCGMQWITRVTSIHITCPWHRAAGGGDTTPLHQTPVRWRHLSPGTGSHSHPYCILHCNQQGCSQNFGTEKEGYLLPSYIFIIIACLLSDCAIKEVYQCVGSLFEQITRGERRRHKRYCECSSDSVQPWTWLLGRGAEAGRGRLSPNTGQAGGGRAISREIPLSALCFAAQQLHQAIPVQLC